jgi:hypothetical protein
LEGVQRTRVLDHPVICLDGQTQRSDAGKLETWGRRYNCFVVSDEQARDKFLEAGKHSSRYLRVTAQPE